MFVYVCGSNDVDVGTFGMRLLSVLQPVLHWNPLYLISVSNGRSKTVLPVKLKELAWHEYTHIYCTPSSTSLSVFLLACLYHHLVWRGFVSCSPPPLAACGMLVWPCHSLLQGLSLGDQAPLFMLYCVSPSIPAMEQLRQISLTVTIAVRLSRGWK